MEILTASEFIFKDYKKVKEKLKRNIIELIAEENPYHYKDEDGEIIEHYFCDSCFEIIEHYFCDSCLSDYSLQINIDEKYPYVDGKSLEEWAKYHDLVVSSVSDKYITIRL
jgi:hypothetical protein